MSILLVAIPVCAKDVHLVERNLERCIQLDGRTDHLAVICHDGDIDDHLPKLIARSETYFSGVSVFKYDRWRGDRSWPHPQNHAWQCVTRMMGSDRRDIKPMNTKAWLWWEADATPLKPKWLDILLAAYIKVKTPFFGNIVEGRGHMNGVALYPFNVSHYCTNAMLAKTVPFDVVLSSEVRKQGVVGRGNDFIAHSVKHFGGEEPTQLEASMLNGLPSTVVLYHGCSMGEKPIVHSLDAIPGDRPSLMQVLTAWRCGNGKYAMVKTEVKQLYTFTISTERPTLWHVTERHKTSNSESERKAIQAESSWVDLYKRRELKPCHVWRYPRSSASIGDTRNLPFLKDVLCAGLTKCRDHDIVVWTNDDTILHSEAANSVLSSLSKTDACSSFRVNFEKGNLPKLTDPVDKIRSAGKFDLGRDLFAFRASWLIRNWNCIPDFYLGELEFDLVLAVLIRKLAGQATTKVNIHEPLPACELERGYVIHELHQRIWVTKEHEKSPAKAWNQKLCRAWYSDHGYHALISKPTPI